MTKKELTIIFMEAETNKSDVCVEVTVPGQNAFAIDFYMGGD